MKQGTIIAAFKLALLYGFKVFIFGIGVFLLVAMAGSAFKFFRGTKDLTFNEILWSNFYGNWEWFGLSLIFIALLTGSINFFSRLGVDYINEKKIKISGLSQIPDLRN